MHSERLEKFFNYMTETGKSLSTRQCYRRDVQSFLEWQFQAALEDGDLEPHHLQDFSNYLIEKNGEKPNSVRRKIIAVRMFARFCVDLGQLRSSPFDESIVPERDETLKCELKDADYDEMLSVLSQGTDLLSLRNKAIFHLLATEGLKATEITDMKISDLLIKSKILSVRGDKGRTIVLSDPTCDSLKEYIKILKKKAVNFGLDGLESGPSSRHLAESNEKVFIESLFFGYRGQGAALRMQNLSRHGLKFILYELGEKVGLKAVNSENLRHLAISRMLQSGLSMDQVQKHLGIRQTGVIRKHMLKLQKSSQEAALI